MCKFIGKSNERILCKLNKSEILRLYSIVHVAMETMKTSNFTCQSKSFISTFFTCQVSACEVVPFSCHDFANDIHSQTAKTVFSHLKSTSTDKIWHPGSSCIHTPYIKLIIQNITQQLLKVIWEDATTFVKPVFVYNHTVPTNQKPPGDSYFTKLSYRFRKQWYFNWANI